MARYRNPQDDDFDVDAVEEEYSETPRLSPTVQAELAQGLSGFVEALAVRDQPGPDRFVAIIGRLDQGQNGPRQEQRSRP